MSSQAFAAKGNKLKERAPFDYCSNGCGPLLKLYGEGYKHGRHEKLTAAWFCRKCTTLTINPNLNFSEVRLGDLTTPFKTAKQNLADGKPLFTLADKRRALGMPIN